jgi:hypothetical protein
MRGTLLAFGERLGSLEVEVADSVQRDIFTVKRREPLPQFNAIYRSFGYFHHPLDI